MQTASPCMSQAQQLLHGAEKALGAHLHLQVPPSVVNKDVAAAAWAMTTDDGGCQTHTARD